MSLKKETNIDMTKFKLDVESGNYTIKEISSKYDLTNRNVRNISDRNSFEPKFKSTIFEPKNAELCKRTIASKGKTYVANKYGVTLAVINGWCKRVGYVPRKYAGLVRQDVDEFTNDIIRLYHLGYSPEFISQRYNTSRPKIMRILTGNNVSIRNKFDEWKYDRDKVKDNIDIFIKENADGLNLIEISDKYGISYEQLKRVFKEMGVNVQIHSYNKSKGELDLKEYLISKYDLTVNSIKNTHDGKQYEIDCFIPDKNFGIEYCGEYWHSYNNGLPRKYHYDKYMWCKDQDITLITIFEHEWYNKRTLLESMIQNRLGLSKERIYGRDTMISIISNPMGKMFHDKYHIHGGLNTSHVNIGLFYHNELVSVTSFAKSRFSKDAEYEILRFSSKIGCNIIGGFSKMLKYFMKLHDNPSLITYSDLRFGEGEVYKKTGFEFCGYTPPNYWYYYKNSGRNGKFESRIKYQKHKLIDFDNFSHDKTEYEIMHENGYLKIFDCGNAKYIYNK